MFTLFKRNLHKGGLPAISRTDYLFVTKKIPVVLTTTQVLGRKGEIVQVPRGRARDLVKRNLGVYGTLWENVDLHADVKFVRDSAEKLETQKSDDHFSYLENLEVSFERKTKNKELTKFIDVWELLERLSVEHEIDLLPENLPNFKKIEKAGDYEVQVNFGEREYKIVVKVSTEEKEKIDSQIYEIKL